MDICPNRDSPPEHFSAANINPSPTIYISPKKTMSNYAKRNSSSDDNETALNALKSYSVLRFAATKCLFDTTPIESGYSKGTRYAWVDSDSML